MDPWCIPGIGLIKASATRSLALRHMLNFSNKLDIKQKGGLHFRLFSCQTVSAL